MATPIRGKKGEFAGSIGDGKTHIPTESEIRMAMISTGLTHEDPGYEDMYKLFQEKTTPADTYTLAEYTEAVAKAKAAAEAYYDSDALLMADYEYDVLVDRIAEFEETHPDQVIENSVTTAVAAGASSGGAVTHSTPMLSLEKVTNDPDGASRFVDTVVAAGGTVTVEPKMDGLAVRAEYVNGQLTLMATRGDGNTGEDVTSQAVNILGEHIDGLPVELEDSTFTGEVRGEIYMSDRNFDMSNEARITSGKPTFANPRNAVAGSLRRVDSDYAVHMSFAAYGAELNDPNVKDYTQAMSVLESKGFRTAQSLMPDYDPANPGKGAKTDADSVQKRIDLLKEKRETLGFPIDGAVMSANSLELRQRMGAGTKNLKSALAYKYPALERSARILDIEVSVGRTSRMGLRARIEPVLVDGSTIEYASMHSVSWTDSQHVGIGSRVMVKKAGDVIPRITGGIASEENANITQWKAPKVCPGCGKPWDKSQLVWRCTGGCGGVERISYFTGRDCADIEGMSDAISKALMDSGKIGDAGDLYSLSVNDIAETPMGATASGATRKIGTTVATKLYNEIQKSKNQDAAKLLAGVGLRSTGRSLSRRLMRHFGSFEALRASSVDQLMEVEGIGSEKATIIHSELRDKAPVLDKLVATGVNTTVAPRATTQAASGGAVSPTAAPLAGKKVVVTGAMTGPLAALKRNDMNVLIEEKGGQSSGSVSSSTSLLVCGEPNSSKYNRAVELGVPVVTPEEFAAMIDFTS